MLRKVERLEADVVIAGGGPGGCVLANDLAKKGKKPIIVDQGGNNARFFGNSVGMFLGGHIQRSSIGGFTQTIEGDNLLLGNGVGGGTKLYAGIAGPPDINSFKKHDIDLAPYIDKAMEETWVSDIPDDFFGPKTRRIADIAGELGYPWKRFQKHIDFNRCKIGCTACVAGCKRGAKWSGKIPADEAVKHGARLLLHTKVRDVIVEKGSAIGVRAQGRNGQQYEVLGNAVVCCAGGVGSAPILKRSGISEAGKSLSGDPFVVACGFLDEGTGPDNEHEYVSGWLDDEHGIMFSTGTTQPRLTWFIMQLQQSGIRAFKKIIRYRSAVGVWIKIHDEDKGRVFVDGNVSKTFTSNDMDKLEYGKVILENILIKAGCNPSGIYHGDILISHPSGTSPIGRIVDANLETPVKNLYCCDTSVMPEAPGRPPTLTVVCLAKRMADRLGSRI